MLSIRRKADPGQSFEKCTRRPSGLTASIWVAFAAWVLLSASAKLVNGQGTGGPIVNDSKVGYIDCAIPSDIFRVRYDSTYNNRVPSRAEFFYAQGAPLGPGLPFPESSVDYQDISAYMELRLQPGLSGFVDVPVRFLNPDINDNTRGIGDLNAGFKYALRTTEADVLSFQLRTFVPTGDAQRGLGTNHVSLEPAILFYESLGERAGVEAECRYWVPIGGTDFAGEVVRYGIGAHYDIDTNHGTRLSPVVEVVGWTVLAGKESVLDPLGGGVVRDADGTTIVNSKLGMRLELTDQADLYAGWGRGLTGDRWYENTYRLELRLLY